MGLFFLFVCSFILFVHLREYISQDISQGALRCLSLGWGIRNFIVARGLGISAPRGDPGHLTHVFSKGWMTSFL